MYYQTTQVGLRELYGLANKAKLGNKLSLLFHYIQSISKLLAGFAPHIKVLPFNKIWHKFMGHIEVYTC